MSLRLYALAAQLGSLWTQVEWTKRQCFPQPASGEHLDFHAEMRGLMRTKPTNAKGFIRFETEEIRQQMIFIEKGTVCLNAAGAEFVTLEDAQIKAGKLFCDVEAKARKEGSKGNAPAESICFMALAPVGVMRCFNPEAFRGGSEAEGDESLRDRVLKSYANLPNGSNRAYYEAVALDTDGVAAACVLPRVRGLGTVDLVISGQSGLPPQEAIDHVSERLEREREICVDIQVKEPVIVPVEVKAAIEIAEGYEFNEVSQAVCTKLEDYFDGRLLGKNLLLAKLGNIIFGVEGVLNYSILQPAADILVSDEQLPAAREISIVEG